MSAARRPAPLGNWPLTIALILALLIALGGLGPLLDGTGWWFTAALIGSAVLLAAGIARALSRRAAIPPVVAVATCAGVVTLMFAPGESLLGVIPTLGTIDEFTSLGALGVRSISTQSVPATATSGISFLLAASAGVVAVALELLVFLLRKPALTGILLFGMLAVPGFVNSDLGDPVLFVLTAAAWLLVLAAAGGTLHPGLAARLGVTGIVAALVLSIVLPPVDPANQPVAGGRVYSTGINPMIDLGDDLRRDTPQLALTYTTTADRDPYFTLATLDDFTEFAWQPTKVEQDPDETLAEFDPAPGRDDEIEIVESTTDISIGNINGRWLPAPYAPTSITGLDDEDWFWEPGTLSVRSSDANIRGLRYSVASATARPTLAQLRASDGVVPGPLERFLALPDDLPPSVVQAAVDVTAAGATAYDKAALLQSYFRSGQFEYSEEAPVEDGYDGTSPQVIERFLQVKAGYCVHFSSAMATMARAIGIPARIGVGFTAGTVQSRGTDEPTVYAVTTDNLHAWPELYFNDVGWVRFEPTAGRGSLQTFAAGTAPGAAGSDPAAPQTPEGTLPSGAPVPDQGLGPDPQASGGQGVPFGAVIALVVTVLVIMLVLSPANARAVRRRLRLRSVAATGAAEPAWHELRDTVHDLTRAEPPALTPREFAGTLAVTLGELPAASALDRLREAIEAQSFARDAAALGPDALVRAADVHEVLAALREAAGQRDRWAALLLPASELRRWQRALLRTGAFGSVAETARANSD